MKTYIEKLYNSILINTGFCYDYAELQLDTNIKCYNISPEKGEGYYWIYFYENMFVISIRNLIFYEDFYIECPESEFISITYFDSVSGEELDPYKKLYSGYFQIYVGQNSLYKAIFHKNVPVHSISIEIRPEYYQSYLKSKYAEEYVDPHLAFLSLLQSTDFPDLVVLLKQIQNFRGTGMTAKLYYEGKVLEAMSLIMEKIKSKQNIYSKITLSEQDLFHLKCAVSYIDENFANTIRLEELSRIACMGNTKLKSTFKEVYKCTITEYIVNKRIKQSEHLLSNTDLSIEEIANIVGYKKPNSFSKRFRNNTGLLPREYRKLLKAKPITPYSPKSIKK